MTSVGWHVGFVRSIMHGRDGVTGDLLVEEARRAGAEEAHTFHATGNVVFRAAAGATVCDHLTDVVSGLVDRDTTVIHRTAEDVEALVSADLFATAPAAAELLVVLSSVPLDRDAVVEALPDGIGLLGVHDRYDGAFWRADTTGPHPHPLVERLTGASATARSISTIEGVHALLRRRSSLPPSDPA